MREGQRLRATRSQFFRMRGRRWRCLPLSGRRVSLSLNQKDSCYLLGRLFALYELVDMAALGRGVHATIRDNLYDAAASQPRSIFPLLDQKSERNLALLDKGRKGLRFILTRRIAEIKEAISRAEDPFPSSLLDRQRDLFKLGYDEQRSNIFDATSSSKAPATIG